MNECAMICTQRIHIYESQVYNLAKKTLKKTYISKKYLQAVLQKVSFFKVNYTPLFKYWQFKEKRFKDLCVY